LRLVSPLLGAGLLARVGARPVILIDAGTFVVATAGLLAPRLREPRPARTAARWRAEFGAGIAHVARTPALRQPLVACFVAVTAFGFFETVPFAVVAQGLHRSPEFLGVLISPSLPLVLVASTGLGLCLVWVDATLEFAITVPQVLSVALGAALIAVVNYRILLRDAPAGLRRRRARRASRAPGGRQIACPGNQREDCRTPPRAERSETADA
jgi:hypothetical protein